MESDRELLDLIIDRYLSSLGFNGLTLRNEQRQAAVELVSAGLVQIVAGSRTDNPHIRRSNDLPTIEEQLDDLADTGDVLCAYPTPAAMAGHPSLAAFSDSPYRLRLASGIGQFELVYFTVDVIEPYRNDPRFDFRNDDFEVTFAISDEAYLDPAEPSRDNNPTVHVGFAYDVTTLDGDAVVRRVCAFIRDLARLTPEHQRRWEAYEVENSPDLLPNPMWMAWAHGRWEDGIGPFNRILEELAEINSVFELITGEALFSTTDRPRSWGWVLRPSTQEWHDFVLTTDKLLSDNVRSKALDAAGVPKTDDSSPPVVMGTLRRLEWFLVNRGGRDEDTVRKVLQPLHIVRKQRQKPAHALDAPVNDPTLTAKQRDMLVSVIRALEALRVMLSTHPRVRGRKRSSRLDEPTYVL